jgi:hypothetical protein
LRYEASREGGVETVGSRAYASSSQEVIMKHTLIAIGLLATISHSPAIFKIPEPLFCILNTFAAVIAVRFARRLAAYIRSTPRQMAATGC